MSVLLMIFISPLESTILLSASAESKTKNELPVDHNSVEADNSSIQDSHVPIAKMVYNSKSYEMSPFVVVENEQLKRLNFPQLPDDFPPVVQIPSDQSISFSFLTKPREINAFFVDYDADTTEMTPLKRIGENQFSFADVSGPNTLELRVIYPDGKYVTYTCLIEVKKPEIQQAGIAPETDNIMNGNDNSYGNFQSTNTNSPNLEQTSPTEKHVLDQYGNMVNLDNEQRAVSNIPNSDQSKNNCEYNKIQIAGVQTDRNINNSDVNSNNSISKPRWTALDLGQQQYVCGIKVTFANPDNKIKFFTVEFSNDGKKYTTAEYYSSTGTNSPSEIYDLKQGPVKARFIKLTELDITESMEWISDLTVLGNNAL
ncbi:MAG: discoidin domain-containing protein [Thaumarchaeota archaeon]|nr:MAG: discoidin domain-containing protein [Nitrososphaerota archaeon]